MVNKLKLYEKIQKSYQFCELATAKIAKSSLSKNYSKHSDSVTLFKVPFVNLGSCRCFESTVQ